MVIAFFGGSATVLSNFTHTCLTHILWSWYNPWCFEYWGLQFVNLNLVFFLSDYLGHKSMIFLDQLYITVLPIQQVMQQN